MSQGDTTSARLPALWKSIWLVLVPGSLLVFAADDPGTVSHASGHRDALVLRHVLALDGETAATALGQREWQFYVGWDSFTAGWKAAINEWGFPGLVSPQLVLTFRSSTQGEMTRWLTALDVSLPRSKAALGVTAVSPSATAGTWESPQLLSDNEMLAIPDSWAMADAACKGSRDEAAIARMGDASHGPASESPQSAGAPLPAAGSLPLHSRVTALLHVSVVRDALQRLAVSQGRGLEALLQFWSHVRAYELGHPLTVRCCPGLVYGQAPSPPASGDALTIVRGQPISVPLGFPGVTPADAASCAGQARALHARFLTADPLDSLLLSDSAGGLDEYGRLSASGIVLAHVPPACLSHVDCELSGGPLNAFSSTFAAGKSPSLGPLRLSGSGALRQQLRPPAPSLQRSASGRGSTLLLLPPPDCFAAARAAVERVIARELIQPLALRLSTRMLSWAGYGDDASGPSNGQTGARSDSFADDSDFRRNAGIGNFIRRRLSVGPSARKSVSVRSDSVAVPQPSAPPRSRTMAAPADAPAGASAARRATISLRPPSHRGREPDRRPSQLVRGNSVGAAIGSGANRRTVSFFDTASSAASSTADDFAATSAAASLLPLSVIEQASAASQQQRTSFTARASVVIGRRLSVSRRDSRSLSVAGMQLQPARGQSFTRDDSRGRLLSVSGHSIGSHAPFDEDDMNVADDQLASMLPHLPSVPVTSVFAELAGDCIRESAAVLAKPRPAHAASTRPPASPALGRPATSRSPTAESSLSRRLSALALDGPPAVPGPGWASLMPRGSSFSTTPQGSPPASHGPDGTTCDDVPSAALALLCATAPPLVSGWANKWDRVRTSRAQHGGRGPADHELDPPVRTSSAAASGVPVDRSVLVLLMHKMKVPVSMVGPFLEPSLRASLPAHIQLPLTPDGKQIGAAPPRGTATDPDSAVPAAGSWGSIWAPGLGGTAASSASSDGLSRELDGSNASLQDAAVTALLISHELQQLSGEANAAARAVAEATGPLGVAARWSEVGATDLSYRVAIDPPVPDDASGASTPRRRQSSVVALSEGPGTPLVTGRSRSGSVSSSGPGPSASTPQTSSGKLRASGRDAVPSIGSPGKLLSPAALALALPSAQPAWLGPHPIVPSALRGTHTALQAPVSTDASAVALTSADESAPPVAAASDRSSRVARLARGRAPTLISTSTDEQLPVWTLPPRLPVPPSMVAPVRVLWTPVLSTLGADPRGAIRVGDDSRPQQPFVQRLSLHEAGHELDHGHIAQADVDFTASVCALTSMLLQRASRAPLLLQLSITGPLVMLEKPKERAEPLPSLQSVAQAMRSGPGTAKDGFVGALHLGSAEILDVAPCRDALAPAHAIEVLLPSGHLTLIPAAAKQAPALLEALRAAAFASKRSLATSRFVSGGPPSSFSLGDVGTFRVLLSSPPLQSLPGSRSASSLVAGALGQLASSGSTSVSGDGSIEGLFARICEIGPAKGDGEKPGPSVSVAALCTEVEKRGKLNRDYQRRLLRLVLGATPAGAASGGVTDQADADGLGSSRRFIASPLPAGRPEAMLAAANAALASSSAGGGAGSSIPHQAPLPLSPGKQWPNRWMSNSQLAAGSARSLGPGASGLVLLQELAAASFVVTPEDTAASRRAWARVAAGHVGLAWADTVLISISGGARANPLVALVAAANNGKLPRGASTPLPFVLLAASQTPLGSATGPMPAVGTLSAQAEYFKPSSSPLSAAASATGAEGSLGTLRGSIQVLGSPTVPSADASPAPSTGGAARHTAACSHLRGLTASLLDADPVSVGSSGGSAGGGLLSRVWQRATGRGSSTPSSGGESDWGKGRNRARSGTQTEGSANYADSLGVPGSRGSIGSVGSVRLQPQVVLRLSTDERVWELKLARPHTAAALAAALRMCGPVRQGGLPIVAIFTAGDAQVVDKEVVSQSDHIEPARA